MKDSPKFHEKINGLNKTKKKQVRERNFNNDLNKNQIEKKNIKKRSKYKYKFRIFCR